jgi:hypothetical protein
MRIKNICSLGGGLKNFSSLFSVREISMPQKGRPVFSFQNQLLGKKANAG